jgi:probable addiction module antidote protein
MIKAKKQKTSLKFSPSVDYHDELMTFLKDQSNAVEYLNAALEESLKGDEESRALFLRALKNIAEAQGSISDLAKRSHICRESIYRILSPNGNPEMQTLAALLGALGLGLKVYDTSVTKQ